MKKCFLGIISAIAVFTATFPFGRLPVAAQSASPSLPDTPLTTTSLQEDVALRTACSKTFQTGENEYLACLYSDPVHFQDSSGKWVEIDNSLIASSRSSVLNSETDTVAYYENAANSFSVSLPRELSRTAPIIVESNHHILRFTTRDMRTTTARVDRVSTTLAPVTGNGAGSDSTEAVVQNQRSRLSYATVLPNTSLQYDLCGQTLKESLVFNTIPAQESFSFDLSYTGLFPEVQDTGEIWFYETANREGDPVFRINAPYLFDSGDGYSNAVTVHFVPTASGAVYTLVPDRSWLEDPHRLYPVTLDPTVTTSTTQTSIQDNSVHQSDPNLNYRDADRLYVGNVKLSSGNYQSRTYIRFPRISSIPTTAFIVQADMRLNHHSNASYQSASNNTIDIYDVGNNNWSTNTITWNTQAGYTFGNRIYSRQTDKSYSEEKSDITALVRLWYATSAANNGLVIMPRKIDTAKSNRTAYYSSDCSSSLASLRPRVTIKYFTMASLANGTYFIRNRGSGQYANSPFLDSTGAAIFQWEFDGSKESMWQIARGSDGYYTIRSLQTNLFWGINGSDVNQYPSSSGNAIRFGIYSVGVDGVYLLSPMSGIRYGKALEVPSSQAQETHASLKQTVYTDNSVFSDQWCLGRFIPNVPCDLASTTEHSCIPCAITHLAGYWSQNGYPGFNANTPAQLEERVMAVKAAMPNTDANDCIPNGFSIFTYRSGGTTYRLQCNNSWSTNWTTMMDQIHAGRPFLLGFAGVEYTDAHMTVCVGYEREGSVRRVFLSDAHQDSYQLKPYNPTENDFMSTVSVVTNG